MLPYLCGNLSQNWTSQWYSDSPDIPTCFQYFGAPIYLLLYLLLCAPYLIYLQRQKINTRPLLKLTLVKLVIIVCLIGLQVMEIIVNFVQKNSEFYVYTLSNSCFIIALTVACLMVYLEMRCNAMNSGFLFNYWILHFTICIIRARTVGLQFSQNLLNSTYSRECFVFINLSLATLSLILSCFSERMTETQIKHHALKGKRYKVVEINAEHDQKSDHIEMKRSIIEEENDETDPNKDPQKECPEYYSSFLSRIVFQWFSPMIYKGFKKPLTRDDLWRLNDEDYCKYIVPKFLKNLQKYLVLEDSAKSSKPGSANNEINNSSVKIVHVGNSEKQKLTDAEAQENENNQPSPADPSKEHTKFDPCLLYALVRCHWGDLLISGFYKLIHDSLQYLGPIFLKLLLQFIANPDNLFWKGYFIAILMLICAMIKTFFLHQYFHIVFKIGMRVRSSVISAVYRKSLVLSTNSRKESTVGEIVNLMSIDSQKFLELISYIHMIWSGPYEIIVALILLWFELGPSVLAGLTIMLLMIPVNIVIGGITRKIQTKQLKVSDSRIKMMNEILNGIKVIKLYAWEPPFIKSVTEIRNKELGLMRRYAYLNAAVTFTFTCAPFLVSLTSFGVFVLVSSENILDAERAFVSIALFNLLRFPLMILPMVISNLIQASVSLKRLTTFLKRAEINPLSVSHEDTPGVAAMMENATFSWDAKLENPTLKNISISFPTSQLMAIVGPVGAGKSSVISALLGEIEKIAGRVNLKGSVAYVPQQAWIVNASIRDNIIFGLPYEACKYQQVIKACSLERDLEILPDSDFTEIGEKGINLSGGQKQRISLARACYSQSDVYLLDDPLSAVDSHVGKDLIEHVLGPTGMLNRSTRILVSHNLTVLPKCDKIVVLDGGSVSEHGSYSELIHHAGPFANFMATHLADEMKPENKNNVCAEELIEKEMILKELQRTYSQSNQSNSALFSSLSKSREYIYQSLENLKKETGGSDEKLDIEQINCKKELEKLGIKDRNKEGNKLIEEETSKEGNVKFAVYKVYLRSIGFLLAAWIVFLFVTCQSFSLGSNLWLVRWSAESKISSNYSRILADLKAAQNASTSDIASLKSYLTGQRDYYLGIYGVLGFSQALCQLCCSICFAVACVKSAHYLHNILLHQISRSPMSVFDSIPVGRIINRFSSDLNSVDNMLPQYIGGFLTTLLQAMAVFILVLLPNQWIIIALVCIIVCYVFIQRLYVSTSRQLKRLESVSKSPIYSHFGETLQGVSSIRAYGFCDRFIENSDEKVDKNLYAYYANVVSNRWLAVILETIGNSIVFFATTFAVLSLHRGALVNGGLVGLSVSYALNITQTLNWLVRMSSEIESNIVAVERIQEYSQLTTEAAWDIPEKSPDEKWPDGSIQFVNYATKYREGLDPVLKNIDFTINPREKVGIVGRTGSGKSSMVLALFRILERTDGQIIIDGKPIHELGLHDIRGRLTIIPQDPVLFSGTLRKNLDPFGKSSDEEIWKVLEMAKLKSFVQNSGGAANLEMAISEGGENLSVGQRQLVCLARALLRRTNILVLDEATAAVDLDTDVFIQDTIRREFSACTILTIAHRLNTVLDYDRIMVLDHGKIVEMDTPGNLLKNPKSHFHAMAKSANLV